MQLRQRLGREDEPFARISGFMDRGQNQPSLRRQTQHRTAFFTTGKSLPWDGVADQTHIVLCGQWRGFHFFLQPIRDGTKNDIGSPAIHHGFECIGRRHQCLFAQIAHNRTFLTAGFVPSARQMPNVIAHFLRRIAHFFGLKFEQTSTSVNKIVARNPDNREI